MKAVLCEQFGPPSSLVVKEVPSPQPGPGQVVVAVHAASVNFPDGLIIENKYQFKPTLPFSPGGEVAGTVKAVGPGVSGWAVGDRVIGVCGWGGFADEVVVDVRKLVRLPEGIAMDAASALVITYGTTHYALQVRGKLQPGETLLVLGAAGGTGLSAIELGKLMGARVIAAASSDEKCALCRELGADETINYSVHTPAGTLRDEIKRLTGGKGPEVVYDPVGGEFAEPAFRSIAWRGRYVVIGFASGPIPSLPLNLPLLKGASIVGVFWGEFAKREPKANADMMQTLAQMYLKGQIKPAIDQTLPMSELMRAYEVMGSRAVKGKLVLVN